MTESKWSFAKVRNEGKVERSKEMAQEMFLDGKNIIEIRKYSKLPDEDLADVLHNLPKDIQTKYSLINN
jgi:hypothetical protein